MSKYRTLTCKKDLVDDNGIRLFSEGIEYNGMIRTVIVREERGDEGKLSLGIRIKDDRGVRLCLLVEDDKELIEEFFMVAVA